MTKKIKNVEKKVNDLLEGLDTPRDYMMSVRSGHGEPKNTTWESPMDAMDALAHDTQVDNRYYWTSAVCYLKTDDIYIPQWTVIVH